MTGKNFYFENWQNSSEQELIENLIIESIRIYGIEVYYIPRVLDTYDNILNEDDTSIYNQAYLLEMYIKNIDNFEGEGDFLSKFGLQIKDSLTLTVAMRRFNEEVGSYTEQVRPKEGDVLYFPLNGKIFQVDFVEHEAIFYQMGSLQTYDLRCELFEYSGERFETGIPEIDNRYDQYNMTTNAAIANVETVSAFADNQSIQRDADAILDFSESNPFGDSQY